MAKIIDEPSKLNAISKVNLSSKVQQGSSSWRNLFAQERDNQLKFHPQVKATGSKVIKLPAEVLVEGIKQWNNCLVGLFIGENPDY